MQEIGFYETIDDAFFKYAVIMTEYQNQWVFCKHRERDTWEIPGGHREPGEAILDTAKRELFEETGALLFDIWPVSAYSVKSGGDKTFGMLYHAVIHELGDLPDMEIESIALMDTMPDRLTYPLIQPVLFRRVADIASIPSDQFVFWPEDDSSGSAANPPFGKLIDGMDCEHPVQRSEDDQNRKNGISSAMGTIVTFIVSLLIYLYLLLSFFVALVNNARWVSPPTFGQKMHLLFRTIGIIPVGLSLVLAILTTGLILVVRNNRRR